MQQLCCKLEKNKNKNLNLKKKNSDFILGCKMGN